MTRVIRQKIIPLGKKGSTPVEHGKYIFAYTHIMTKQVIYSLRQEMKNTAMLRQITYVGKKSKPASIRKDNWIPLITLSFPTTRQGLDAYRKLRELRKFRELRWKDLFTREDAERLNMPAHQQYPDGDQLKRYLMDQKANSIADVATVLKLQEKQGLKHESRLTEQERKAAEQAAADEARDRELAKLATPEEVQSIVEKIRAAQAKIKELKESEDQRDANQELRSKLGKRVWNLQIRKRRMETARKTYGPEGDQPAPPPPAEEEQAALDAAAEARHERYRSGELPLPKRGPLRKVLLGKQPARFTMDGVHLQWYNIADHEYAAYWPDAVEHSTMSRVQWRVDPALVRAMPEVFRTAAMAQNVKGEATGAATRLWERADAVGYVAPDPRVKPPPTFAEIQERLQRVLEDESLEGERARLEEEVRRMEGREAEAVAEALPVAVEAEEQKPASFFDRLKFRYPRLFGKPVQEAQL